MASKRKLRVVKKRNGNGNHGGVVRSGVWSDLRDVDGRTQLGRLMRDTRADLVNALGGDPTPQEVLLIERVVFMAAKCALFEQAALTGKDGSPASDAYYLSWAANVRRTLQVLGLSRRARPVQTLQEYIAAHDRGEANDED